MLEKCGKELARCAGNYFHFRTYSRSVDVPTRHTPGGIRKFPKWDYIRQYGVLLATRDKLLVVKERQLFISWETANYCLWFAMFHYGAHIPFFSKSGAEAQGLLGKAQKIYHNLPDWMQVETLRDNTEELSFKSRESSLKAFTGTKYGGTSFTNSIVVDDEWDYHEYAAENWQAIEPTISEAGRQFIGISTVDKLKASSVFQSQAAQALRGDSPFTLVFFGRGSRPDRDEEWYKQRERSVTPEEMEGLTRELFMAQNYPRTIQEALAPADSIAVIRPETIKYLNDNRRPPLRNIGAINIYEGYHEGHRYVAASDPSAGIGKDCHVFIILDVTSGRVVADIVDNHIGVREMYVLSDRAREEFRFPLWVIESGTEWGGVLIDMSMRTSAKNIYYEDKKAGKCGLRTHDGNRIEMWAECANAVNDGLITVYSKTGIEQLQTLIYNTNKRGRIDAKKGANDDYFSAISLAWKVKDSIKREGGFFSYNYVTGVSVGASNVHVN